jgi:hypothetical protein
MRWIGLNPIDAASLSLSTASLSVLGYEHSMLRPTIQLWNDAHHVLTANAEGAAPMRPQPALQPRR